MIFDSHAHYDDPAYDEDRAELLASFAGLGVGHLINVGASRDTTEMSIALAEKYPFIHAAAGIHPSEVMEYENGYADMDWLRRMAASPRVRAIGEIGLDYHTDDVLREVQQKWFRAQLDVAQDMHLPVIVHSRDAAEDTYEILSEYADSISAVVHCFSYGPEMAERFLKFGYYIGLGGVLTYKNGRKQKEVTAMLPLDKLLLETDCPYLSPEGHRGERNSSLNLPIVVAEMARIRELSCEEIEDITYKNAERFYRI